MRPTALAFAFNAPRFVAFLGPFAGTMIAAFGGYILRLIAAPFLLETKGRPLPEVRGATVELR